MSTTKYALTVFSARFLEARGPDSVVPTSIRREDIPSLTAGGAQLVDVLSEEQFAEAHLPGAINIPLDQLDEGSAAKLDRDRAVIVYCYDMQ